MPTVLNAQQAGPSRSSSLGEDDEERSPNGFNTSGSSFTKKLYEILDSAESCDIVCWTQDGTAFEVKEPKRLEVEILPKYFRHARFQSFVRQLNFYSFKKVSKERSSWIYSHDCFQRNKPDLLDRLRRKTNTSTLPSGISSSAGGEKRMYEMYATSVGLQDHELASTLKVLRGSNNVGEGAYYYGGHGQGQGHSSSHKHQWGYEDEYRAPEEGANGGQREYEVPGEGRLSKNAMQSWDAVRQDKATRESRETRERVRDEPSTSQAVSSLAFLYGIPASQVLSTLPASSSAVSALGSSSDGNRSPDSDDPSEAATDNSQSSRSLNGKDRGSVSSVSLSSAESSHKRSCHHHNHHAHNTHTTHNNNNAQWQAGFEQSDPRLAKVPGYQHYEQDYSSIYPSYVPPRSHHQVPFRPTQAHTAHTAHTQAQGAQGQQQQLLYAQQLHGQLQTQAQTQAQMMHARYLNYQHNVRQGQGREGGSGVGGGRGPKVAPIVLPGTSSYAKPVPDDHEHWKDSTGASPSRDTRDAHGGLGGFPQGGYTQGGYSRSEGSVNTDAADSYVHAKDIMMLNGLNSLSQSGLEERGGGGGSKDGKYVVLLAQDDRSYPAPFDDVQSCETTREINEKDECHADNSSISPRLKHDERGERGNSRGEKGKNEGRSEGSSGSLVLDEPLGDATHALLSFCMQRNPWMYSRNDDIEGGADGDEGEGGEGGGLLRGSGPNALYKDVLSCLFDTPLLREELECYSEALNPSPFPSDIRRKCSPTSAALRRKESREGRERNNRLDKGNRGHNGVKGEKRTRRGGLSEGDSSGDESTGGDLTDASQDSDEQLSMQARTLSHCNNKMRKKDAVEEMRAFTIFASLRMQEVSDLVCDQEVRRASRRELDKSTGRNNWSRGDGTSRDMADSAAAAAFTKALEACTQTWWAYANLYK